MNDKLDSKIIKKYLAGIVADEFHRYASWDNCNQTFLVTDSNEYHSLQLAFYLASWGMYRGSSGLLQKNHLIHQGAVKILFSKHNQGLKCSSNYDITRDKIPEILRLQDELSDHYSSFLFTRGASSKEISATDTLITKILLGTFACVPAYDRYFIGGLKERGMKYSKFNASSLNELFDFVEYNKFEIKDLQHLISSQTNTHYPVMKILDMYFWQIGYDKDIGF